MAGECDCANAFTPYGAHGLNFEKAFSVVPGEINCATCPIGPLTIYGPYIKKCPEGVCARRKAVLRARPHQLIQSAGDPADWVFTVFRGWALRSMHFPDGRRQVISILLPGDTGPMEAVWADGQRFHSSVRALTHVIMCTFSPEDMRAMVFGSDAQRARAAEIALRHKTRTERRLADIGRRRAIGRIAHLVLDVDETLRERGMSRGDEFDFPLRQEDIADMLGLTKAHVNRTLVALRKQAILEIKQGRLYLLNRQLLTEIAAAN